MRNALRAETRIHRMLLMENFGRRQGGWRRLIVSGGGYDVLLIDLAKLGPDMFNQPN